VISASHNPYPTTASSSFPATASSCPTAPKRRSRSRWSGRWLQRGRPLGRARRVDDAGGRYIEFCKSTFPAELDLKSMKIVVDCAHGAAYNVAPHVFHELGADVVPIGVKPTV